MTVFKQIVGRGSLVHEDTKNVYFSVVDFRGATSHFCRPRLRWRARPDLRTRTGRHCRPAR